MRKQHQSLIKIVLCSGIYVISMPIAAQDGETTGLEEIIVTAQRRAENVQDIPVTLSAFSATELEARGITDTLDLVQHVPNVIGHNNVGLASANVYFIRGLGNTESIATFDPPVGTYIDDIYISRQNANNFSFFDVERVEVLRGPQGTLFGRNTTGGAVRLLLKKPQKELGGFFEASYGRFNERRVRSSIDVPVSEKVLTKLSGYFFEDDGDTQNINTGERVNDEKGRGLRGAIRLFPHEDITWDAVVSYNSQTGTNVIATPTSGRNVSSASSNAIFGLPARAVAGNVSLPRFSNTGLRKTPRNGPIVEQFLNGNGPLFNKVETYLLSSNLHFDLESVTIEIITGYIDLDQKYALDFFDGAVFPSSPYGTFSIVNDGSHDQFSQEIKATGSILNGFIDYVAGLYYINEHNDTRFAQTNQFRVFNPANAGSILDYDRLLQNNNEEYAGYLQIDWNFTDQLTLTTGMRYSNESKKIAIEHFTNVNPAITGPTTARFTTADLIANGIATRLDTSIVTPRFALQYAFTDDLLVFASATRGFKSGGWNARSPTASQFQEFTEEKTWSYEAGFKSEWLEHRLRLNVTGFYGDTTDNQIPTAFTDSVGAVVFLTRNFADLEVYGAEIELSGVVTPYLSLYSTLGLQSAEYKNLDTAILDQQQNCITGTTSACGQGIITPNGAIAHPVRTPDVSWTTGFNSIIPLDVLNSNIVANGSIHYVDDYITGTANTPESFVKSYWLTNASLGIQSKDEHWGLFIECSNCLGTIHTAVTLAGFAYYNEPSSWRLRTKFKF